MNEQTPPPFANPGIASSPPKTSALAIWSLVLGIMSLLCFTIFAGIPGVICGHMAIARIRNSGGGLVGNGLAIAGLVTGYLGIAWAIVFIPMMMAIAIPNFVKAREVAMTNACINNLRQIDAAKNQWAIEHNKKADDTPTENDLTPYLTNHQMPICPAGGTYTIGKVSETPTCTVAKHVEP